MRKITGMMIAGVGFGVALTLFGVAVVDAMRVETAPEVIPSAEAPTGVQAGVQADASESVASPGVEPSSSRAGQARDPRPAQLGRAGRGLEVWAAETTSPRLPRIELERAVNQDPFQPDRRAPAQRYVLPGQSRVFAPVEREPTPRPSFRVVGAARIGQGGLALVQVDDGDVPIAVSVGESIEGYRLASVTEEGATFEGATSTADGSSWALSVVEPREERPSRNNRGNNNRGRNTREQAAAQEAAAQLQQLIQGGLQGLLGGFPQGRAGFRGRGGGGGDVLFEFGRGRRGGGGGGGGQ